MKRLSPSHPLSIAHEIIQGGKSFAALEQWPKVKIDTAISLVLDESIRARRRADATKVLSASDDSHCLETCEYLLETSRSSLVRQAAVSSRVSSNLLQRRVEFDQSYVVRRKALAALPPEFPLALVRIAASDPHWRVRMALIEWIEKTSQVEEALCWKATDREVGFAEFLRWRQEPGELPKAIEKQNQFGWDDDPAVLLAELKKQPREEWLEQLPFLVHHTGTSVSNWAVQQLFEFGTSELCHKAAKLANDPRHPGWQAVEHLANRLDSDRRPDWKPVEPLIAPWSKNHPVNRACEDPANETSWLVLRKYLNEQRILAEQILPAPVAAGPSVAMPEIELADRQPEAKRIAAVSYTHLTLPTKA